jgi:hypothetical protein
MTSGKPLSDQEQLYVLKWANRKTWGAITDDLNRIFGIHRSEKSLSNWYQTYTKTVKPIQINVPQTLLEKINEEDTAVLSYLFSMTVSNYFLAKTIFKVFSK